jgi:hypothetical protein
MTTIREKGALTSATPGASGMFVFEVPGGASRAFDLSDADYLNLLTAIGKGRMLSITADFDLWYRWGTETGEVDETATAEYLPLKQAESLYASERLPRQAPTNATFLIVKGEVDTYLRITIVE